MSTQDPFDPRKFRPYHPAKPGDRDEAAQPPPRGDEEPAPAPGRPAPLVRAPAAVRQAAPDAAESRPDDIVLRGDETLLGILAIWAVAVIAANARSILGRFLGPGEVPFWTDYVLVLVEHLLILMMLFYLLYVKHSAGLVDGLHLHAGPVRWTVAAAVAGVALQAAALHLPDVLDLSDVGDVRMPAGGRLEMLLITITAISGAFARELYYRGLIFPLLRRGIGTVLAVLVVTAWFALAYFPASSGGYWMLGVYAVLGLATTLARHYSRSLGPPVAMHLAFNVALCTYLWLSPHPLFEGAAGAP